MGKAKTEGGRAIYFTDTEVAELRRLLLPGRMAHHDTSAEAKIRAEAKRLAKRSKRRLLD